MTVVNNELVELERTVASKNKYTGICIMRRVKSAIHFFSLFNVKSFFGAYSRLKVGIN